MDLETELTRLAHSLDRAAPSITADEALDRESFPALVDLGHRRHLRRRLAVVGAALLVAASVIGVVALRQARSEPSGSSLVIVDSPDTSSSQESTIPAAANTSTTLTIEASTAWATLPPPGAPTIAPLGSAAAPTRLYLAGDSTVSGVSAPLFTLVGPADVATEVFYKVSSGLSRPDFFDWPARLRADLAITNPAISVVMLGTNDAQDLLIDGRSVAVDDPAWADEYARRVTEVLDILTADGRSVIWVGVPMPESPRFADRMRILEEATREVVVSRPGTTFIDTWNLFAGPDNAYVDHMVDPADGIDKIVRDQDGFHLNLAGTKILANHIADAVIALLPTVTQPATSDDRTLSMGMTGDDVRQVQQRLTDLHFQPGPVDGEFGSATRSAVWAFEHLILGKDSDWATGSLSAADVAVLDGAISITARRPDLGHHVEIYLPEQVLVVYVGDEPVLISHISSGTEQEYRETVSISPGEEGNADGTTPLKKGVIGLAVTPGGTFTIERRFTDGSEWVENRLGRMYKPWFFNYGLAIHGSGNAPLTPASHGAVRVPMHVADALPDLLHVGDAVYVWDGVKEPEEYDAQQPVFDRAVTVQPTG